MLRPSNSAVIELFGERKEKQIYYINNGPLPTQGGGLFIINQREFQTPAPLLIKNLYRQPFLNYKSAVR